LLRTRVSDRNANPNAFIARATCRQRDLAPHQRQCLDCIAADFRQLGHDPLDITAYRSTTRAIMCRCVKCGKVAAKRLGNLRISGPQCEDCWAPVRAEIAARARFTQEQAAEISIAPDAAHDRAYAPTANRIRAGNTECFMPGEPVHLQSWIEQARQAHASTGRAVPWRHSGHALPPHHRVRCHQ
jgi:hypothetical protein